MQLIDGELWAKTRAGARAGRGFRYQDAATAWFIVEAWAGKRPWTVAIPEGLEDTTLHNPKDGLEFRVQIKSKHDSQGKFAPGEIASYRHRLPKHWNNAGKIYSICEQYSAIRRSREGRISFI